MKSAIEMDRSLSGLRPREILDMQETARQAAGRLYSGEEAFTGWVDLPETYDRQEVENIRAAARKIAEQCTALVVVGIGGSYLGARAVYEMLTGSFAHLLPGDCPRLFFAGQNISAAYHKELLEVLDGQEVCLCVISKSGTTAEPAIAFALLKDYLVRRYGETEASARIYAVTDAQRGVLRAEADKEGYGTFVVPDDIGGRYSVLTPVGLLPLAAAGFDPEAFLQGAGQARQDPVLMEQARDYAICRNLLYRQGKTIEIFESYEPRFAFFAEWLKQLFGESEGKGKKGIFPASLNFTSDLHSMGQFLQEGTPCFFETVLAERFPSEDLKIPDTAGPPLAGRSVTEVNKAALEGVAAAHRQAGVPIFLFGINGKISPQIAGQVVYFFETACALSAYMMGVDPFDQPGVEAYKREMRERL
jgi:glucose-6-phosphate isomerase